MTIYQITFSPTGGTQRVADRLAESMSEAYISVDLCDPHFSADQLSLTAEDLCIVSVPSFGGRVPALAAERMAALTGNGAMAVPVAVYGNREYEDTLIEMKNILAGQNFRCIAAVAAIAEHSMLRQYAAGRPDADDLTELSDFAKRIAEAVSAGSVSSDLSVPGNFPYRQMGAFLKPEVTEDCMGCGVCADMCPAGAISADNPQETNPDACISCVRCVSLCPVQARRLNPATLEAVNARIGKALSGYKKNELFI